MRVFVVVRSGLTIGKWGKYHLFEGPSSVGVYLTDVTLLEILMDVVGIGLPDLWILS